MQPIRVIKLVNGGEAIVEERDYERLSKHRWFRSSQGYAYRQGWTGRQNNNGTHWTVWMHRYINCTPAHLFTDHINGNKLDNRRSNLRTVNKAQNSTNRPKIGISNASCSYKGVSWHKLTGLWRARIRDGNFEKTTYHKTEQQAALDYNRMALEHFGEFSAINRLPTGIQPTIHREKSSQFRGVVRRESNWEASIEVQNQSIYLGSFSTEIEAAKVYNNAAIEHRGPDTKLNLIPKGTYARRHVRRGSLSDRGER